MLRSPDPKVFVIISDILSFCARLFINLEKCFGPIILFDKDS